MKPSHAFSLAALACTAAACKKNDDSLTVTHSFVSECNGPFTIQPIAQVVVRVNQNFNFTSTMPFPLSTGWVRGYYDLTIPTFPDRFFGGSLRFAGPGGDSLFGSVTVQTSTFTDPLNPGASDFTGAEDFTGTFEFTGGTGRYAAARGSGTYTAHSDYVPPTTQGAMLQGTTTLKATGTITVLEECD